MFFRIVGLSPSYRASEPGRRHSSYLLLLPLWRKEWGCVWIVYIKLHTICQHRRMWTVSFAIRRNSHRNHRIGWIDHVILNQYRESNLIDIGIIFSKSFCHQEFIHFISTNLYTLSWPCVIFYVISAVTMRNIVFSDVTPYIWIKDTYIAAKLHANTYQKTVFLYKFALFWDVSPCSSIEVTEISE
jgi:hypothetical protein